MSGDGPTVDVVHLTNPAAWAEAQATGRLAPPSLATEGFVHCSTAEQVPGTIERHYGTAAELLLLHLDEARLGADLRWEESRPGEVYPHLYRALAPEDVVRVEHWTRPGS